MKCYLVFKSADETIRFIALPARKPVKLDFLYEYVQVLVISQIGQQFVKLTWGDEGREIALHTWTLGLLELSDQNPMLSDIIATELDSAESPQIFIADQFAYISEVIPRLSFIDHLVFGEFALDLLVDDEVVNLGRINRTKIIGASSNYSINFFFAICAVVYDSPKSLIYEELFARRSNVCLRTRPGSPPRPLSKIMSIYRYTENALEQLASGSVALPNQLKEGRSLQKYHPGSRLDLVSIQRLVSGSFVPAATGAYAGNYSLPATPEVVDIPSATETFDVLDNKLLIQFLVELGRSLEEIVRTNNLFEGTLARKAAKISNVVDQLCRRYGVSVPQQPVHGMAERYSRSSSEVLRKLANAIRQWNQLNEYDPFEDSETLFFNTHTADKIWEYFCLERIVSVFESQGLGVRKINDSEVELADKDRVANIVYDKTITSGQRSYGILNVHSDKRFKPDFLVSLKDDSGMRIGVFDAKYNPDEASWPVRAEEIEKYGLWLRRENGEAIDYVHAMVPSPAGGKFQSKIRGDVLPDHINHPPLDHGYISLLMGKSDPTGVEALTKIIFAT